MAKQKQDDQPELTYSSYVRTQDVTQKTCRGRWTIGKSGERWLEKKLDGNYTRMLRAILNKSRQKHPTRHQGYPCKDIRAGGTWWWWWWWQLKMDLQAQPAGTEKYTTLQRSKTSPPTSVLDKTLNNLIVRVQPWSFGECRVPFHCHRSLVHSVPEWYHLKGSYLWGK